MEISEKTRQLLELIEKKYKLDDQQFEGYLEGLLYQEYLDYWDYVNLDALLSLQHPRTHVKDEMIFIIYHQITELYFKLCLWEYDQILHDEMSLDRLKEKIRRINSYFKNLTHSFEIMVNGMEKEQFLQFRLALLPASGFQSAQYRRIEIASTNLINLVNSEYREKVKDKGLEDQYEYIYWKYGATLIDTGNKTLTLRRFEDKYADEMLNWAHKHAKNNLWTLYQKLEKNGEADDALREQMRELDLMVNVNWPLVHFKSAARYLKQEAAEEGIPATGGTNWEKYLPPRFQRRIFFPELWEDNELEQWGRRFTRNN